MSGRFDIVTVCFSGDLALLKLQARSLRLFFDPHSIGRIVVIENDSDPESFIAQFRSEVLPQYGELAERVACLPRSSLLADTFGATGWRVQQALKLMVAGHLQQTSYLVLDAKNHFLRHVGWNTFIDSGGRFASSLCSHAGSMATYLQHSLGYFGVASTNAAQRAMPATTPYLLDVSIVRYLLDYVEAREKCSFAEFFLKRTRFVTEFFMYFGFMLRCGIAPELLYYFDAPKTVSLFTRAPDGHAAVVRALRSLRNERIVALGLHRNRLPNLQDEEREYLNAIWRERGLLPTRDDLVAFWSAAIPEMNAEEEQVSAPLLTSSGETPILFSQQHRGSPS